MNDWLFDFEPAPDPRDVEAYCGYSWLRAQPRFPLQVARVVDERPALRRGLRAPLRALHYALAARRAHKVEEDWRRPRREAWTRSTRSLADSDC